MGSAGSAAVEQPSGPQIVPEVGWSSVLLARELTKELKLLNVQLEEGGQF